jgi:hypothetical protein
MLARLSQQLGVNQSNFFSAAASWHAWTEEILCDFIGLLTFGPSFVAAECNLLYAMDPAGSIPGPRHPPVGCRANYLLSAAHLRGYTSVNIKDARAKPYLDTFWSQLKSKRQANPWFDIFTQQQIKDTADALADLLRQLPPALYVDPPESDLSLVLKQLEQIVPPVGSELNTQLSVACRPIDFRHVLYAGWAIAASPPAKVTFSQINRLCEHGIMQQRAVDLQLAHSA